MPRRHPSLSCALFVLLLVTACGDGGSAPDGSGGPGGPGDNAPLDGGGLSRGDGSARFSVDVATGEVSVTPVDGRPSRATFAGTAVDFDSSVLLDQPGSAGRRVINVSLTNRSGETLGGLPGGQAAGIRVIFSSITTVASLTTDRRQATQVSTVLGGVAGTNDGPASQALVDSPVGVAVLGDDVFIADYNNHRLRKLSGGLVTTFAGSAVSGGTDGVGSNARFLNPAGLAAHPTDGSLWVAEYNGQRIRRVDAAGRVTTIAGDGTTGDADGTGDVARFRNPLGLAIDAAGTGWLTEAGGHRLRRIVFGGGNPRVSTSYTVSTIAGNGTAGFANGGGGSARFNEPAGITVGGDGALYVCDRGNHRVRRVTTNGDTTTIAGTGGAGGANGRGDQSTFNSPYGLVYVDDTLVLTERDGHRARVLQPIVRGNLASEANAWRVATLAGSSAADVDGNGFVARFNRPRHIAADAAGTLYLVETDNHKLRRLIVPGGFFQEGLADDVPNGAQVALSNPTGFLPRSPDGTRPYIDYSGTLEPGAGSPPRPWAFFVPDDVAAFEFTVEVTSPTTTLAPPPTATQQTAEDIVVRTVNGGPPGSVDGDSTTGRFGVIGGMDTDAAGVLYLSDSSNARICRLAPGGEVHTIAGRAGVAGLVDDDGVEARFNAPSGLAVSDDGRMIVVVDRGNHAIRLVRQTGSDPDAAADWTVTTISGNGTIGYADGSGFIARWNYPFGVALVGDNLVFVTETLGQRVRMISFRGGDIDSGMNWVSSTVAGATILNPVAGYVDGDGANARFNIPRGIAVTPGGDLVIAEAGNAVVRRIVNPSSAFPVVSTLAGTGTPGYVDGLPGVARFQTPNDVVVDRAGTAYVCEGAHRRLRRVTPDGRVSTVLSTAFGLVDGVGPAIQVVTIDRLATDSNGRIYFNDTVYGSVIRQLERLVRSSEG